METQTENANSIANQIEEFKTVGDAQKVLKFKVIVPKNIQSQFNVKYVSTISREVFQICYSNGKNDILFRMGQDIDNISGDYNEYKNNDTINLDNESIKLSGNFMVLWNKNVWNFGYSPHKYDLFDLGLFKIFD